MYKVLPDDLQYLVFYKLRAQNNYMLSTTISVPDVLNVQPVSQNFCIKFLIGSSSTKASIRETLLARDTGIIFIDII